VLDDAPELELSHRLLGVASVHSEDGSEKRVLNQVEMRCRLGALVGIDPGTI
jgi:hypothetical protein